MKLRLLPLLLVLLFAGFSVSAAEIQQVATISVPARYIKSPMRCTVVLPETYLSEGDTAQYPVVYLLNGYGGDHSSWIKLTEPNLDEMASQHGVIIVCPDGRDSWYWDSPECPDMQMESFFVKELIPYIDKNYRTYATAGKRAIAGFSMGGHGSLWLAMRHPDIFGSCGSMSGGVNINKPKWAKSWKMATRIGSQAEHPQRWIDYTVLTLVPTLKTGELNIIIDCGVDDFFIGVNRELHDALLNAKIPHDYTERPGRHTHPYWRNSLKYHLLYFSEIFKK